MAIIESEKPCHPSITDIDGGKSDEIYTTVDMSPLDGGDST